MATIHGGQHVELLSLPGAADRGRRLEVQHRLGPARKRVPWYAGHEAGFPIRARPAAAIAIGQDDERWQVLILGAESVRRPATQARPAGQNRAGVHLADRADVIQPVGPARANDGQLVGAGRDVRQPVRDRNATLSGRAKDAPAGEQGVVRDPHRRERSLDARGQRLTGQCVDQRLWIERIELAWPAIHEEENHALARAARTSAPAPPRATTALRAQLDAASPACVSLSNATSGKAPKPAPQRNKKSRRERASGSCGVEDRGGSWVMGSAWIAGPVAALVDKQEFVAVQKHMT